MSDITKCEDTLCPSKECCYRFTATAEIYQSYGKFNREEDAYNCDMYWDNGKCCKFCHQKNAIHKISCPTQKATIVLSDDVQNYYDQMEKEVHWNRSNLNL